MGRLRATWHLAEQSWGVLRADPELLWLPVMSMVASGVAMATFLVPLFAGGAVDGDQMGPVGYVVLFALYVVTAFITIFFNAALVSAADERMHGGDPTVSSALSGAASHLPGILSWALISATVSVVLRAIEERAGFLGRIVAGIAGVAWSLVTFLVIPVLVIEGVGAVDAVKRAGSLFKQTWGEQVAGQFGFGLLGFLVALPGIAIAGLGVVSGVGALAVTGIVVGVLWIVVSTVVISALNGIFQTALYRYAADGESVGPFAAGQLGGAFARR